MFADQVLTEWKKKTKNDAATRLATVLHAVSKLSQRCCTSCVASFMQICFLALAWHYQDAFQHQLHNMCGLHVLFCSGVQMLFMIFCGQQCYMGLVVMLWCMCEWFGPGQRHKRPC